MYYHLDDVFDAAKKYDDLKFKKIDLDIYVMLKSLVYDLSEFHKKIWEWPPNGFIDNITKQLQKYDTILTDSLKNNYPLNGSFIMGMAELLEKLVENNVAYIKRIYIEKALEFRDRASAVLVMVRLFEMEDIDIY